MLARVERALSEELPRPAAKQCRKLHKKLGDVRSDREQLAAVRCEVFGVDDDASVDRLLGVVPDVIAAHWQAGGVEDLIAVLNNLERFEQAAVWSARLVEWRRQHPQMREQLVWALGANARMLADARDPDAALPFIDEAIALAGADPMTQGVLASERAFVLHELNRNDEAVSEQERALALLTQAYPPLHPRLVNERSDLALIRIDAKQIETARREYVQLLDEVEAVYGPDSEPALAIRLGLVHLLDESRDYDGALVAAIDLQERAARVTDPTGELALEIAVAHGWVAVHAEQFEAAIAVLEPVDELLAQYPDDGRLRYRRAQVLFLLAGAHREHGAVELAVEVGRRAQALAEASLPPDSAVLAGFRSGLANTLLEGGHHDEALAVLDELAAGPLVGEALEVGVPRLRAVALSHLGRSDEARPLARDSLHDALDGLDELYGVVDDGARIQAADGQRRVMGLYLSLHDNPDEASETWTTALALKGIARRALVLERGRRDADDQTLALHAELRAVRQRLAAHAFGDAPLSDDRLEALHQQARHLDRQLVASSAAWRQASELVAVDPAAICAQLGQDEVLVDYMVADGYWVDGDDWLVAWLVKPDCTVQRLDLPHADGLAKSIRWHRGLLEMPTADSLLVHIAGATVRQQVWDPLAENISAGASVVVVPDGPLAEVSFASLPHAQGFLVEDHRFRYLESALDLTRSRPVSDAASGLVIGVSDFSAVGAACTEGLPDLAGVDMELQMVGRRLGGAGLEVESVGEATVGEVRERVAGHRVVHVASHGYFPSDGCAERPEDPLLASGLVLGDGVWPARDVGLADLRSADLVVLSACSTGNGESRPGEGVLGLRRGFATAGAGTLVMSLWSVDDLSTGELMDWFYQALLDEHRPPAEALHAAQLRALKSARARGDAWPGSWGAFIVSGG